MTTTLYCNICDHNILPCVLMKCCKGKYLCTSCIKRCSTCPFCRRVISTPKPAITILRCGEPLENRKVVLKTPVYIIVESN